MTKEELNQIVISSKKLGVDFHGTLDSGKFEPIKGTIVITGTPESEPEVEKVKDFIDKNYKDKIDQIIFNETDDIDPKNVGEFKAKKIKECGFKGR